MNASLNELRDIALPEPVSWWPPAPGYWALLLICIMVISTLAWLWHYWHSHLRYVNAAKREFKLLREQTKNDEALVLKSAQLIKRYMTSRQSGNNIAQLSGNHWKQQLTPYMSEGTAQLIAIDQYKTISAINREQFSQDIMSFIKRYKP